MTGNTLSFLRQVLPDKGNYCWVTIKNKKATQGFVPTIEELARKLLEEDAKGIDTYFACASYLQPTKRKSDNACGVKAFWLDIDAGPGKPYTDADAAVEALDEFCNKAGLPFATIVCSGNGIHAWWPLDRTIEPKEWKEYAARFKALCDASGFHADPTRTADVSSILRAPGTRNFKRPEAPKAVAVMAFEEESQAHSPASLFPPANSAGIDIVRDWEKLKPKKEEIDLGTGYGDGQRTEALVKRAGLLFGPAHNLTLEDGIAALQKWNLLNTPPLPDDKVLSTATSIFKSEIAKRPARATEVLEQLPKLPFGYKWNTAGRLTTQVPVKTPDGEETLETVEITEFPLYLLAVTRKEREYSQAYVFCFKLPHEEWREFKIACHEFESKNWKTFMATHTGHCVLNDKLFINYVHNADSELRRKNMDAIRYQQFGWKEDDESFLIGDTLIHAGGKVERVYGGEEIAHRMKQMSPRKGGSLNAWTADANLLFSDQYIHLGYALVASFATTLLKFCMGESDGGFVLSITSPGSGKGKTRTIEAATSVWGELESLQITPRDTLNAQMAIVASACNLPVFMDEWNEKDSAIQAKFLRQLTVGHDKNRAQRDGTVKAKPASYKTLLITTSNHSICSIMNLINDEAAAARVVEIVAPDMDGDVFKKFDKITGNMLRNAGFAGREFIYQLMQPGVLEDVKEQLTTAITKIREHLHTEGKHRYVTVLPAAILVTASLLVKHGILEFDVARLVKWSFEHVSHRVNEKVSVPPSEILSSFLNENLNKILMVDKPYLGKMPVMILNNGYLPASIIARSERETKRMYLSTFPFKIWCAKNNHDFDYVMNGLVEQGILLDNKKRITLGAGTTAPGGRVICWELNTEVMEGVQPDPR
jgi:hypothetical protein